MRDAYVFVLVVATATILAIPQATHADDQRIARGRALAARYCSACHAIGSHDQRPHDIVLPFREFHVRYPIPMLEDARQSGVVSGHDEMPGFDLSMSDVRVLLVYIDTFAPADRRYLKD